MQPIYVCYLESCIKTGSGILITPDQIKVAAVIALVGVAGLILKAAHHCITYVARDD